MTDFKDLPLAERQAIMKERNRNGPVPFWLKYFVAFHENGLKMKYFPLWILASIVIGYLLHPLWL